MNVTNQIAWYEGTPEEDKVEFCGYVTKSTERMWLKIKGPGGYGSNEVGIYLTKRQLDQLAYCIKDLQDVWVNT